jgi:hypothetical protein
MAGKRKEIKVTVNLGGRKPTPAQIEVLKEKLKNQVLAWAHDPLVEEPAPTVVCDEFGDSGNDNV